MKNITMTEGRCYGETGSRNMILKLSGHDSELEMDFELKFQRSLSIKKRFELTSQKTREMTRLLEKNGHRKAFKILKRT